MAKETRINLVHNLDIEKIIGKAQPDTIVNFANGIEREYTILYQYSCQTQELYWDVINKLLKKPDYTKCYQIPDSIVEAEYQKENPPVAENEDSTDTNPKPKPKPKPDKLTKEEQRIKDEKKAVIRQRLIEECKKQVDDDLQKERIDAINRYNTAKAVENKAYYDNMLKKPNMPRPKTKGTPGFRPPQRHKLGKNIHNAVLGAGIGVIALALAKKIMCGRMDNLMDLPNLGHVSFPEFNMPDTSIGAGLDLNLSGCLAKYVPPMFNNKNIGADFKVGKGDFGKLGEMAEAGAKHLKDAENAINKAIDSVNDALNTATGAVNKAVNDAVGAIQGAVNQALGSTLGMGASSGFASALKNLYNALSPIVAAALAGAAVALGAIALFNKMRDALGNDLTEYMDYLNKARADLINTKNKLLDDNYDMGDGNFRLQDKIQENMSNRIDRALREINNAQNSLNKAQDILDEIQERSYTIDENGNRVYRRANSYDGSYNEVAELTTYNIAELFCGVPRTGTDEYSQIVNKLQKNKVISVITPETTAKDAQLRALENLEMQMTINKTKSKALGRNNTQGCEECGSVDPDLLPKPKKQEDNRIRDALAAAIYEKLIADCVKPTVAKQVAKSMADNDVLTKLHRDGWVKEFNDDMVYKDGKLLPYDTIRYNVVVANYKHIRDLLPSYLLDMPIEFEADVSEFLKAIDKFIYGVEQMECDIEPLAKDKKCQEEQGTAENVPTPRIDTLPNNRGVLKLPQDDPKWKLVTYRKRIKEGNDYYYVNIYTNGKDILTHKFLVINGLHLTTILKHLIAGKSEAEAQQITADAVKHYVLMYVYLNGEYVSTQEFSSACEMLNSNLMDADYNRKDIVDGKEKETSVWKAEVKDDHIKITNKLTGEVTKEKLPEDDKVKVDNDDENINKGSAICDEVVYWLINNNAAVQYKLREKGIILNSLEAYEYVKYILLPRTDSMYHHALEACRTGRYEDFGKESNVLVLDIKKTNINDNQDNNLIENIPEVTIQSDKYKITLPIKKVEALPGSLVETFTDNDTLYIDVKLANQPIANFEPVHNVINLRGKDIKYISTVTVSDKDQLIIKKNHQVIHKSNINVLTYTNKDIVNIEVI